MAARNVAHGNCVLALPRRRNGRWHVLHRVLRVRSRVGFSSPERCGASEPNETPKSELRRRPESGKRQTARTLGGEPNSLTTQPRPRRRGRRPRNRSQGRWRRDPLSESRRFTRDVARTSRTRSWSPSSSWGSKEETKTPVLWGGKARPIRRQRWSPSTAKCPGKRPRVSGRDRSKLPGLRGCLAHLRNPSGSRKCHRRST
jgi:hypothetical protein